MPNRSISFYLLDFGTKLGASFGGHVTMMDRTRTWTGWNTAYRWTVRSYTWRFLFVPYSSRWSMSLETRLACSHLYLLANWKRVRTRVYSTKLEVAQPIARSRNMRFPSILMLMEISAQIERYCGVITLHYSRQTSESSCMHASCMRDPFIMYPSTKSFEYSIMIHRVSLEERKLLDITSISMQNISRKNISRINNIFHIFW